jgi:O-succinylbenzoic acid--CoA ligase
LTYQAHDALAIIHTSGTSGKPKGAVLTHGSILASAIANEKRIPLSDADRWLCVLPLYHVGGLSLLFRAAHSGFTVDLYSRFDVTTIDTALCTGDVTLISLVPTMLYRLLREGNPAAWRNLRFVLLGGAAASQELLALARQSGVRVATTYGMTEAGSQVATALPDLAEQKPGTVGKPLDGVQVKIVDDTRKAVGSGQYGEIAICGEILMREYDNQPQATTHSLQNGWYFSGDIGYLDADGDLFLVQRRSDLIVTGGENVYPAEVEAVLRQHPAVEECVVVGIPDAEWGQRVAAAIILREGATSDAAALETFAREYLAGYKIPRLIRFVRVLPLTASGKIERHRVQEMLMQADSEGS